MMPNMPNILEPANDTMQKTDSLYQFGYHPVLGINVMGRLVPIKGRILLGADNIKEGFFFAGYKPDHCFYYDECYRYELKHQNIVGHVDYYKEFECEKNNHSNHSNHKVRGVDHIKRSGVVVDAMRPLNIHQYRDWYVGTDFYMPKVTALPADNVAYASEALDARSEALDARSEALDASDASDAPEASYTPHSDTNVAYTNVAYNNTGTTTTNTRRKGRSRSSNCSCRKGSR